MGKGFLAEGAALQKLGGQKSRRDPRYGWCREWWGGQLGDPAKPELVTWFLQEGGLEPRSWRTWEMGRSEAWGQAQVRGWVLK